MNPNPPRRPVPVIVFVLGATALLLMAGLGVLIGATIARNQTVHTPIVGTTLAAATATAEINATQTEMPTPTALPAADPLTNTTILTSEFCASTGTGCRAGTTNSFTTSGPFVILYECYHDFASPDANAQLQIQVFDSTGHQVDVLSEPCQGVSSAGNDAIIPEKQPAGTYSISIGATTGPSWVITMLEYDSPTGPD
jgi:hypothetical protein